LTLGYKNSEILVAGECLSVDSFQKLTEYELMIKPECCAAQPDLNGALFAIADFENFS